MYDVRFHPTVVQTFMGGSFTIERPARVGDLKMRLQEILGELNQWADETEIDETVFKLEVTLKHGIVQ